MKKGLSVLESLVALNYKAMWDQGLVVFGGEIYDLNIQFFNGDSSIQVLYFFLGLFWHLKFSPVIYPCKPDFQIAWHIVLIIVYYFKNLFCIYNLLLVIFLYILKRNISRVFSVLFIHSRNYHLVF
jgi:hypothetical protein